MVPIGRIHDRVHAAARAGHEAALADQNVAGDMVDASVTGIGRRAVVVVGRDVVIRLAVAGLAHPVLPRRGY